MLAVLLSTFNGELFLSQQLDSLIQQTYQDFTIWVRDDGSSDSTKEIIEKYKALHPDKFNLVDWESCQNIGFAASFIRLLEVAKGDLYFFCDQDDIWYHTKLENYYEYYQSFENKSIPILLLSDFNLTGLNGEISNFYRNLGIDSSKKASSQFSFLMSGCIYCLNGALKSRVISSEIVSKFGHDVKTFFITLLEGEIGFISKPTMKYRIHDSNVCGYKRKQGLLISLKDFVKFFINAREYRKIILRPYFELYKSLKLNCSNELLNHKEIYSEEEVNRLSIIQRKLWYRKHFLPYYPSYIEGFLKLLTF
jgi:rhamnosyltransferase